MNAEVVTWDAFDLDQLMGEEWSLTGELIECVRYERTYQSYCLF